MEYNALDERRSISPQRMNFRFLSLHALLLGSLSCGGAYAATLTLTAPLDYQVVQRFSADKGRIPISGVLGALGALGERREGEGALEVRVNEYGKQATWQKLSVEPRDGAFQTGLEAPAGGWYRLEFRVVVEGKAVAETSVEHVGVGEVFVVAGQSNSANYGAEKTATLTGRVSAFDGKTWRISQDPQPGAGGNGGSFMPGLGDTLADAFHVPVGFVACGAGGTSVRAWLPKGVRSPVLPTGATSSLKSGEYESPGTLYGRLTALMKTLGPQGFRAVLWHQGESDANQKDPTRTLPGELYQEYLQQIIRDSRTAAGWEVPWFVAQVSYHVPGDEASPDIRGAQAALWSSGVALQGPDTDTLKGELRERQGQGVHFSGDGLRAHAGLWAQRLTPWLKTRLAEPAQP